MLGESSYLFRSVNERISELTGVGRGRVRLRVRVRRQRVYARHAAASVRVRRAPLGAGSFAVVPGHELGGLEEVLRRTNRYVLVRQLVAAEVAA
jgi:hypothetical protein